MYNNPLGKVIRRAFIKNVLQQPLDTNGETAGRNTIANILRHKRICLFEQAVNKFITSAGEATLPAVSQFVNEKNLLTFSLQLSGYIRDAQKELEQLKTQQACDPDLIALYQAAAKYSADCNSKIEDSKYIFHEHCDYNLWKVQINDTLSNAEFIKDNVSINPERRNLFLFMPFHISGEQNELRKWSSKYLNNALDNKQIFSSQVDIWLIHFPLEQPRGEKFAMLLKTMRNPEHYFEDVDMRLVKKHFSQFLGRNIVTDENNRIISGQPHDNATFQRFLGNITTLGYCAGGAHTLRWFNALAHQASQLYDRPTQEKAYRNIFNINYAFLPPQPKSKCSGAHFMSNYGDDSRRKEPFVKMANPELYELVKYRSSNNPARISIMPDERNHIIAFKLPEDFAVFDDKRQKQYLPDLENGHHMAVVTARNANSFANYPQTFFTTVLENASLGYRGNDVFRCRVQLQNKQSPALYNLFAAQTAKQRSVNG